MQDSNRTPSTRATNDNDGPRPTGKLDRIGQAEQEREHGHARACMLYGARSDHSNKIETEHCSRDGAMALAKRLECYWHDQGYPSARFWAEPIEERFEKVGTYELYRVVCNLVNGLPPRYKHER